MNKTVPGVVGIYYGNASISQSGKNISAVFPYADGDDYARNWIYTYTACGGASQTWTTQSNGTRMQTNTVNSANKCNYVANTLIPGSYQVTAKIKAQTAYDTVTASYGSYLGNDGAWDIAAVPFAALTTQNAVLQDNNAYGANANNNKTLSADNWFIVDGITTGSAQRSRIHGVNVGNAGWEGSGTFTSSANKRVGIYSPRASAVAFDYWYAWNGTILNLGNWSAESSQSLIGTWGNNYTDDAQTDFFSLTSIWINFNVTNATVNKVDRYEWSVNGTNQTWDYNNFTYGFPVQGLTQINVTLVNVSLGLVNTKLWNVTALNYSLGLISPGNNTNLTSPVTLLWREWHMDSPHTYYVSTDYQFINIAASGLGAITIENGTASASLNEGVHYYWRVKNNSGYYSEIWEFTINQTAPTPGRLNITAFDEQVWDRRLMSFSAQVYNTTSVLNKSTTTGWANFSSSEVSSGEYLVRIVPNSSYASRSVLATSPANVSLWLPPTTATINTIAFYLLDYTTRFPYDTSVLYVFKNNTVMHSSYFDADAKVAVYLIQGDSYGVRIVNGNNLQEWGNYIPVSSGNVEITLTSIGINTTELMPYSQVMTYNTSDITLRWQDHGTLYSLNFTISKGSERQLVHSLITSVSYGLSSYTVTNTSASYYVEVYANTSRGWRNQSLWIDYTGGTRLAAGRWGGIGYIWQYGSYSAPDWIYTALSIVALILLGGGFGALYAPLGGVIVSISALFFMWVGWMNSIGASLGFIGGLAVAAILYYLRERESGVPSMMAYKAAMFLIFANAGIIIINASGIFGTVHAATFSEDVLTRLSVLVPAQTQNTVEKLVYLGVTVSAFGLLVYTLGIMLAIFAYSSVLTTFYLNQLPISLEWKAAFTLGALLIYIVGFNQYKANTSLREQE